MRRLTKFAIAAAAIGALFFASQKALAYYSMQMSWDTTGQGALGNFDLDLQVNNGLTFPYEAWNATYGVHSSTAFDSSGFFVVSNRLGLVLTNNSPQLVRDVGAINATQTLTSGVSPWGLEGRWVHETPTLAYRGAGASQPRWMAIWQTFPKSHPYNGEEDPYYIDPGEFGSCGAVNDEQPVGRNFPEYGWIGMRTWDNTNNAHPDPDLSSIDTEVRMFAGLNYDSSIESSTSGWATGTPIDPVPSNSLYQIYSEPGAFVVDGTLYVAMTGNYCLEGQTYGDIILVKSTNWGASWSYIGILLTAGHAQAIDADWAYYTASSMHRDPSDNTIRLIVTGMQYDSSGSRYQGIVEYAFSNIATGALVSVGGVPAPIVYEPKESGVFTGAGTYNISTGKHVISRLCITTGCTVPFTEWELSW